MVTELEVLKLIAECLDEMDNPDIRMVSTFGGGANGAPGLRVDHADGSRSYLVPVIGTPDNGRPVRAGFVDLVMNAISITEQTTIVRTSLVVTVDGGPTGLTVTTSDGWDLTLRAVSMVGEPPSTAWSCY